MNCSCWNKNMIVFFHFEMINIFFIIKISTSLCFFKSINEII